MVVRITHRFNFGALVIVLRRNLTSFAVSASLFHVGLSRSNGHVFLSSFLGELSGRRLSLHSLSVAAVGRRGIESGGSSSGSGKEQRECAGDDELIHGESFGDVSIPSGKTAKRQSS